MHGTLNGDWHVSKERVSWEMGGVLFWFQRDEREKCGWLHKSCQEGVYEDNCRHHYTVLGKVTLGKCQTHLDDVSSGYYSHESSNFFSH